MPGSLESGRAGNPAAFGSENVMNSNGSAPANIEYLRSCEVCDTPFLTAKRNARCCTRKDCRAIAAEFDSFYTLECILGAAPWAGAPSQKEMQKEYFKERMWDGLRRLPHSDDLLGEVLIEIVEDTSK